MEWTKNIKPNKLKECTYWENIYQPNEQQTHDNIRWYAGSHYFSDKTGKGDMSYN